MRGFIESALGTFNSTIVSSRPTPGLKSYDFCSYWVALILVWAELIADVLHFFDCTSSIMHTSWKSRLQTLASLGYKDFGLVPANSSAETSVSGCLSSSTHWLLLLRDGFENELSSYFFIKTLPYMMAQLLTVGSSIIYCPFYFNDNKSAN